jgi:hypothetical protein
MKQVKLLPSEAPILNNKVASAQGHIISAIIPLHAPPVSPNRECGQGFTDADFELAQRSIGFGHSESL